VNYKTKSNTLFSNWCTQR